MLTMCMISTPRPSMQSALLQISRGPPTLDSAHAQEKAGEDCEVNLWSKLGCCIMAATRRLARVSG